MMGSNPTKNNVVRGYMMDSNGLELIPSESNWKSADCNTMHWIRENSNWNSLDPCGFHCNSTACNRCHWIGWKRFYIQLIKHPWQDLNLCQHQCIVLSLKSHQFFLCFSVFGLDVMRCDEIFLVRWDENFR